MTLRNLAAFLVALVTPVGALAQAPAAPTSLRMVRPNEVDSNVSVTVSPSSAVVAAGGTLRLTALVTGASDQRVTWTTTGGTIASDGTFTAPATPATVRVVATVATGMVSAVAEVITRAAAVEIGPGQDIRAIVSAAPPGTAFLLRAGVHRLQAIRPRDGDTFTGEAGAVLSGARLLTSFARVGALYVATGQTQEGMAHGYCESDFPQCRLPEELFIDDRPLLRVGSLDDVSPGRWYFDYGADRIYFADDPSGRRVETSVVPTAIEASANDVTVSGLTFEKYANIAQHGVISAEGKTGWVIARNEVRWNHGLGIRFGPRSRVIDNRVHHNGQLGIGGAGTDVLVERNEIAYNNTARFDPDWEAGGTKFAMTDRLIVRENTVHHNGGQGLWTDVDNINTIYEQNTVEDNERVGIYHEISYAAIIRHNIVRRNGWGFPAWIWGAGIVVAASPNVEVYGNTVEGNGDGIGAVQQQRGSGAYGPHEVWNLWVHDNVIANTSGWTGLVQDIGDTAPFTSRNNRFERNSYTLGGNPEPFHWMNLELDQAGWTSFGHDADGQFAP